LSTRPRISNPFAPRLAAHALLGLASALALWLSLLFPAVTESAHDTEDIVDVITPERVKFYIDSGEKLMLIDLRPLKNYQQKRLPGAHSVPLQELEKRLREIPRAGRVVLYCSCPQSQLIQDAYQVLKDDHGYRNISIMPEGFEGWVKRKFPVESGSPQ